MIHQVLSLKTIDGKKHKYLYHYTKCVGVQGILLQNNFWATKSAFLNDRKEFFYIIEVIREVVERFVEQKAWRELLLNDIFTEEQEFRYEKNKGCYVLSFSTCADSITLWSEFGDETGYNLAFESQAILKQISEGNQIAYHGYVIYSPKKQRNLVKSLLLERIPGWMHQSFEEIMEAGMKNPKSDLFRKYSKAFQKTMKVCALFFKQKEFRDEKEYRLAFRRDKQKPEIFREKNGFLLPYIEVTAGVQGQTLPVSGITVAPMNHTDLARKGMDYFLASHGYEIPVVLSSIKLRY